MIHLRIKSYNHAFCGATNHSSMFYKTTNNVAETTCEKCIMQANKARKMVINEYHLIDSVMVNERQLQILRRLKQKKIGSTRMELTRFLMCNESTVSKDLKSLQEKGYIVSKQKPNTVELLWSLRNGLA